MTSFALRLIAVIAMLLDHTAYVFVPAGTAAYDIMRSIGRIALPIFAFLIAEGFEHTHSRARYALRLAGFAVASEIPFDFAFHCCVLEFSRGQNVFFTLLFGLIALTAMGDGAQRILCDIPSLKHHAENRFAQLALASPAVLFCGWLAERLNTDYGWVGVTFICAFYVLRDSRPLALAAFAMLNTFGLCTASRPLSQHISAGNVFHFTNTLQWFALAAIIPLSFYDGTPGSKKLKYFFYSFYPAHLLLLGALVRLLRW